MRIPVPHLIVNMTFFPCRSEIQPVSADVQSSMPTFLKTIRVTRAGQGAREKELHHWFFGL